MHFTDITPAQAVLVGLANAAGLDKELYEDRIAYGKDFANSIDAHTDLTKFKTEIKNADEPELFAGALLAIKDIKAGKPTGYRVGQDAANSGVQLNSAITRCEKGLRNTGMSLDRVPDMYTAAHNNMKKTWQGEDLVRTQVKRAAVPYMYGSLVVPSKVFGSEGVEHFDRAWGEEAPGANALLKLLINSANANADAYYLCAPDGYEAVMPVTGHVDREVPVADGLSFIYRKTVQKPKNGDRSLVANSTHVLDAYVLRELNARCNYDPIKWLRAINAIQNQSLRNIEAHPELLKLQELSSRTKIVSVVAMEYMHLGLGGLDESYIQAVEFQMRKTMASKPFEVLSVHDEFTSLPNYYVALKSIYNVIVAELYQSDWLPYMIKMLTGLTISNNPFDHSIYMEILGANYFVH